MSRQYPQMTKVHTPLPLRGTRQEDSVKERKAFIPLHPSGVHGGAHSGKARLRWHGDPHIEQSQYPFTPPGRTARRGRFTPSEHRSARTPPEHTAGTVCTLVYRG